MCNNYEISNAAGQLVIGLGITGTTMVCGAAQV